MNKKLRLIKNKRKSYQFLSPLFFVYVYIVDCIDGVVNATQIYCWSNVIYVTDPSIRSVTAKLGGFKFCIYVELYVLICNEKTCII